MNETFIGEYQYPPEWTNFTGETDGQKSIAY